MSRKNDISQNEANVEKSENGTATAKLVVKKKRFKKSDLLVFAICVVAAVGIWMYASNLQEDEKAKELSQIDAVVNNKVDAAVDNKVDAAVDNKVNEAASNIVDEASNAKTGDSSCGKSDETADGVSVSSETVEQNA